MENYSDDNELQKNIERPNNPIENIILNVPGVPQICIPPLKISGTFAVGKDATQAAQSNDTLKMSQEIGD